MKVLPYWVIAAVAVASLLMAVINGGDYWIIPAIVVPLALIYAVVDRRLKRKEGPGERLAAEPDPKR
jgi:hypothetical protein